MEEILQSLEAQLGTLGDDDRSRALDQTAREHQRKLIEWKYENLQQHLRQKDKMFGMVFIMTIITYGVVLIVILSQVVEINPPESIKDFFFFGWLDFEKLDNQKFALILTGFLAELLLLPKIILTGLFGSSKK